MTIDETISYPICNKWKCKDGTILVSRHRHDYVTHVDSNGESYFLDGGLSYFRHSGNMEPMIVYNTDPHDKIRENFEWTSYGVNGDEDAKINLLKDLSYDHICAIIRTQTRLAPHIKKIFQDELTYRSKKMTERKFASIRKISSIQNIQHDFLKYQEQGMLFERTEKLHGTSVTFYVNSESSGVCSRNLDLKEEDNTYWNCEKKYNVINKIKSTGRNLAIQGEIYGSFISGNMYKLNDQRLAVFDIFDIDTQTYLLPEERWKLVAELDLPHVPLIGFGALVGSPSDFLTYAEGNSTINPFFIHDTSSNKQIREGDVYKSMTDSTISFKVVSNQYLLRHE